MNFFTIYDFDGYSEEVVQEIKFGPLAELRRRWRNSLAFFIGANALINRLSFSIGTNASTQECKVLYYLLLIFLIILFILTG